MPLWANEGLAEYFAGTKLDGSRVRLGGVIPWRLRAVFVPHTMIPFDELMTEERPSFLMHADARYAQSWAVVHYLVEGDEGHWLPLFRTYLEQLRAGHSPLNAYNRTFGRVNMDALEEGWTKHVYALAARMLNGPR